MSAASEKDQGEVKRKDVPAVDGSREETDCRPRCVVRERAGSRGRGWRALEARLVDCQTGVEPVPSVLGSCE